MIAGLLGVTALVAYVRALGPSSLWRDDAWVALVTKADGLAEFRLVAVTAPGFSALLKGWFALVGFDEWKAQLVPLAFAVAAPALLYLVFVRHGIGRLPAATGALVLLAAPQVLIQSTRLKQYTLDELVAVCLLALTWSLLEHVTSRRRWWTLALAGIAAFVLSSLSVVLLATALAVCLVALLRTDRSQPAAALVPTASAAAFAVAWWLVVLRPAVSTGLELYWTENYVVLDHGLEEAARSVVRVCSGFVRRSSSVGLAVTPFLLGAFVVTFRRERMLGVALFAPLVAAFVLAVLHAAPFGTGRTDIYLYPALATAVAIAVHSAAGAAGGRRFLVPIAFAASVLLLGLGVARTPDRYPIEDVRPLVAHVEARARPSDGIIAFPLAAFAYGLYASSPVDFVRNEAAATGFSLRLGRPGAFVTGETYPHDLEHFAALARRASGRPVLWTVVSSPAQTVDALGEVDPSRRDQTIEQYVAGILRSRGYRGQTILRTDGGVLVRWQR